MYKRTSGIFIPFDRNVEDIKRKLTRNVLQWNTGTYKELRFYEEVDGGILVPRYFPLDDIVLDESSEGEDIEISGKSSPISDRQFMYIEEFKNRNSGIIRLEPGCGKTYIATQIVCHYKKRTIVICHKDKILDQWRDEFLKHTTIKESEIGRMSTSNYRECLKKSIILVTPHVIFRSIKERRELIDELLNSNIGILFVDECHVGIGPEQFSKSSIFVNARRTYGLSATPFRSDGLNDIIEMHLGKIFYIEPLSKDLLKPKMYVVSENFGVYKPNSRYLYFGGKFHMSRYLNQLYKSTKMQELFVKVIDRLVEKNRRILCLSSNVKLIYVLAQRISKYRERIGIFSPKFYKKYNKEQILKVTDTFDLMEAFYKKQIVFSTYSYCRDGNNRLDLDSLVLLTPTRNKEQAIGRIMRQMENKPVPIVIFFVDTSLPKRNNFRLSNL